MKIKEKTRKLAAGCSKHCFEVVDRTDEVSNRTTARRRWRGLKRFSKSIKVYRDEHLIINVSGRGDKDVAAIADYLEAKK